MNPVTSDFDKAENVTTNTASYQMPLVIYYGLFFVITPIYILILGCILKWRRSDPMFKSTFYTILIQHSIADILSLLFYAMQKALYVWIPVFLFKYQHFRIAAGKTISEIPTFILFPVFYNGLYWSMVIRTNGIAFMTLHRFLIIVYPTLQITQWIQQSRPWKISLIFWVPSVILSFACFSNKEIGFDSPEKMLLVVDLEITSTYTRKIFLYLLAVCLVCVFTYGAIIRSIRARSQSVSKSLQREIRLAFQVFLSFAAQVILLIYLLLSNIFAEMDNTVQLVSLRRYFPLAFGTLSFIGPFTILIFNKDVSKRMKCMILRKKMDGQTDSSVVSTVKPRTVLIRSRS